MLFVQFEEKTCYVFISSIIKLNKQRGCLHIGAYFRLWLFSKLRGPDSTHLDNWYSTHILRNITEDEMCMPNTHT